MDVTQIAPGLEGFSTALVTSQNLGLKRAELDAQAALRQQEFGLQREMQNAALADTAQARADSIKAQQDLYALQSADAKAAREEQARQHQETLSLQRDLAKQQNDLLARPYAELTAAQKAEQERLQKGGVDDKTTRQKETLVNTSRQIGTARSLVSQGKLTPENYGKQSALYLNTALGDPDNARIVGQHLFPDTQIDGVSVATTLGGKLIPRVMIGGKPHVMDANENLVPYDKTQAANYRTYTPDELQTYLDGVTSVMGVSQQYNATTGAEAAQGQLAQAALPGAAVIQSQEQSKTIADNEKARIAEREDTRAKATSEAVNTALTPYTAALSTNMGKARELVGAQPITAAMFGMTNSQLDKLGMTPAEFAQSKLQKDVASATSGGGVDALVQAGILPQADIMSLPAPERNAALRSLAAGILALRELDPAAVEDGLDPAEIQRMKVLLNNPRYKNAPAELRKAPVYAPTGLQFGGTAEGLKALMRDL
jgi:hypothetical protein